MKKSIYLFLSLICLFLINASCGTQHCTEDNSKYAYFDSLELKELPYQKNTNLYFYGSQGHSKRFRINPETKSSKTENGGGDPDCPTIYYDEIRQKTMVEESDFLEIYPTIWFISFVKNHEFGGSNSIQIECYPTNQSKISTQFKMQAGYLDSVFMGGTYVKAYTYKQGEKWFKWTNEYGISSFNIDNEVFTLIP